VPDWEKQVDCINLIVGDLDRSKTFYRTVFGLPPLHEAEEFAVFRFKNTHVEVRHDPAHHDAPTDEALRWAQKGAGQFGIFVDDVEAVSAELREHGVEIISGPADRDWGMRTITVADPAGYTWEIAQGS
jgi:catechol 2,3-dioxygenase-like lactoylglutathione lyase family enzyme